MHALVLDQNASVTEMTLLLAWVGRGGEITNILFLQGGGGGGGDRNF